MSWQRYVFTLNLTQLSSWHKIYINLIIIDKKHRVFSMPILFKVVIVFVLILFSINTFATSQQAEELKKFVTWEKQNQKNLDLAFDGVINQITGFQDNAKLDASIAAYHSVVNEHLKGLEALNLQSEEIKPLIAKYKNKIGADNEIIKAAVELGKKPSTEAQDKLSEVTSQSKKIEDEYVGLQNQLVNKFPIEE